MLHMTSTKNALVIISSANLSPTEHLLLKHFIESAIDSDLASQYLISRLGQAAQYNENTEICLRHFKQDWRKLATRLTTFDPVPDRLGTLVRRRDGPNCFMTKNKEGRAKLASEPAHVISPSMLHNIELAEEGRLYAILEAFLSPPYVARLRNLLLSQDSDDSAALQNLMLLAPSVHRAFRAGHVGVRTISQSLESMGYASKLGDPTKDDRYILSKSFPEVCSGLFLGDGTELQNSRLSFHVSTSDPTVPSIFLLDIHSRFATPLHYFYIEDKVARGWPRPHRDILSPYIRRYVRQTFWHLWLYVPVWARLRSYQLLKRVGNWFYGRTLVSWVQQMPFGLYIKECTRAPQNEPNALKQVELHTSIPAPRVVDVVESHGETFLVMTRLPGQMLDDVFHLMTSAERGRLADDLRACVAQLRQIPNNTPYLFADTLGGPLIDHRLPDDKIVGPFNAESDFNSFLLDGGTAVECFGEGAFMRQDHRSYFTHSDFHFTNLLIDQGRLSGIVDWECAGFKPEYWEFTKATWSCLQNGPSEALFRRALDDGYEQELEIERKLWRFVF